MDPLQVIDGYCQRYGVSREFGLRLRPLIERALKSPPEAKKRILDMVERSFLQEASRPDARKDTMKHLPEADRKILSTVANILHNWEPPKWLKYWGELRKGGFGKLPPEPQE